MPQTLAKTFSMLHGLLDRALRPIEFVAMLVAATIMLVVMVLVSADALLRYVFNAPLVFQYTVTEEYLMVALVTLAMAWGFRTGGYIRITGLADMLPDRFRILLLRVGLLISCGYVAVLGWTGGEHFLKAFVTGETRIGMVPWPVYWSWIWVPIGCGLLALRVALIATGPASELHTGHDPVEEI